MPVKRDLSHLPSPSSTPDSVPPDAVPRFGPLLAQRWQAEAVPLARAHESARFRHSDAGNCARAIAYAALDVPASNPMDLAGFWITNLGRVIHELFQDELEKVYGPNVEVEVKVHEGERAGHVDAVVSIPALHLPTCNKNQGSNAYAVECDCGMRDHVISIEYKSAGGYKYKLAVGERGAPEGPSYQHIVQAALNAEALNADECVIIYGARDVISIQAAGRKAHIDEMLRFTAEWTYTREQYEPVAAAEKVRIDAILEMVDAGMLPARKIPDPEIPKRAIIVSPKDGTWVEYDAQGVHIVESKTTWHCAYCRWQNVCAKTIPGRANLSDYVEVLQIGDHHAEEAATAGVPAGSEDGTTE